ncbi:TetR/AcrR family transcriptional regulator [Comamonas fluminis]|uniref:TetR/AcrR family transcriptional regulator n=1 Tax=Comamonas fluminis TaxID=2796366 RepID=UPI001C46C28F|nr:TetR/AcrR family transcriptional regulator [Comamonas fluminis]
MDISEDGPDPATMKAKPMGATEVRQSILDAALKLMSKQGNTDVALREIAREANVNHGLVHRHFGTRQDVLIAALQRHSEIGADYLQDAANIDTAIDKLWSHPNMTESARLMASALLGGVSPQSIAEGHALRKLEQLLQAGDASASPAETTARAVALSCLTLGWGVFGHYLTAVAQDSDPEQLRANVLEVLHAMARPPQVSGS